MMQCWVGTSGFAYQEWKGGFYPSGASDDALLVHYAQHFDAVEINSTFYRMPRASVLERWATQVPESFRFAIKASRRITHQARLRDCAESIEYLWKQIEVLGPRLGPVLFQLPPGFRCDLDRLAAFVATIPEPMRITFEFRHPSWGQGGVETLLGDRDIAWAVSEGDGEATLYGGSWGYARFRAEEYSVAELQAWLERFRARQWREVFCFFKHEDDARGGGLAAAQRFRALPGE